MTTGESLLMICEIYNKEKYRLHLDNAKSLNILDQI